MGEELERICGGDLDANHTHEDHLHGTNGTTAHATA
jgi:hypothetical protein